MRVFREFFARTYELSTYRRFAVAALVMSTLIMITGAFVRLTGSGLGCPDWPSCHGTRPVPEAEFHGLIEFGNRMMSTPTLIAVLLAWLVARRLREPRPDLRKASGFAVLGVLLQIPLGGITVMTELHPLAVGTHFLLSVVILAIASYAVFASTGTSQPQRRSRTIVFPSALLLASCVVIIVLGVLTTAAGPHAGANLKTSPVQRIGNWDLFARAHAYAVFMYAGLVLLVTAWARRTGRGLRDLGILIALIAVQIALGEYQYRNGIPWQSVLGHVTTACLIWITTCWIAFDASLDRDKDDTHSSQLSHTRA